MAVGELKTGIVECGSWGSDQLTGGLSVHLAID